MDSIGKKALKYLKKDLILRDVMEEFEFSESNKKLTLFQDIIEAILGQQLSSKAADTITKRFVDLFTIDEFPTARDILSTADEKIRTSGVSGQKIKYIKNFSQAVIDGSLKLEEIEKLSDEEVIVQLTKIKGIGRWTAEMILIFSLKRPDVFSVGDLGLRTAVAKHYKIDRNDLAAIEKISQKWKPYRSFAARYLWKSLDSKT